MSGAAFSSLTGYAEMDVVQAGSQITITGWMTFGRDTVPLGAATGTINTTGFFTPNPGKSSLNGHVEPTCGRWAVTTETRTFVGRNLHFVLAGTTTFCGVVNVSMTLTR